MNKMTLMLVALHVSFGCGAAEEIDQELDCKTICDRYADCFDEDYDVEECQSNCSQKAEQDRDHADKVNACEACIDDRSCSEGTFKCTTKCVGIVP